MSNSKLFITWQAMRARCYNPKKKSYRHYGAKNIIVCDDWKDSFEVFMKWALENGYQEGLSIERIQITGNYEPSNCKWIPLKEQALNRSDTRWIEFNGVTKQMIEWAKWYGVSYQKLRNRIYKGVSLKDALKQLGINEA